MIYLTLTNSQAVTLARMVRRELRALEHKIAVSTFVPAEGRQHMTKVQHERMGRLLDIILAELGPEGGFERQPESGADQGA